MAYSEKVIDHYQNPKNVGTLDKAKKNVGTGLVGAPECGDVMRLQIKISDDRIGFSDNKNDNKGIGFMNIESRMSSLNGNFYVLSNEKTGSTLHLIMSIIDIL